MRHSPDTPINKPVLIATLVVLYYYLLRAFVQVWTLDANGISTFNHKLPEWDFTNLWAGGMLARKGELLTLFDVARYRAFMNDFFHATMSHMEWSYPPHLLLIGMPLSHLPLLPAYLLFTVGIWMLLALLLRAMELDRLQLAVALFSPAVLYSVLIGQNGCLTACLLLGCLYFARSRPILAGMLLGILSIKPHLCPIAAIALLAMGNWRALLAAFVTASSMVILTTLLLGIDVWQLWHDFTLPYMTTLMNAPHAEHGMLLSVTPYYLLRDIDLPPAIALPLQGIITLACMAFTWRLWRRTDIPVLHQIAFTALLTMLATPYGQAYDLVGTGVAVALLMRMPGQHSRIALYLLWTLPTYAAELNLYRLAIAPLVVLAPLFFCYFRPARA